MKIDLASFYNFMIMCGVIFGAVMYVLSIRRKDISDQNEKNAEAWKSTAQQRESQIENVEKQLTELKQQYRDVQGEMKELQKEYTEVLKLNVALQLEKVHWESEKVELYRRVSELEKATKC